MSWPQWLIAVATFALMLWVLLVVGLLVLGRRSSARALAGFIPDCVVLLRRLITDPRVPRRSKVVLWLLLGYLAFPLDLVPDFIPVAGQADDLLAVALGLRAVLRGAGPQVVRELWPGPPESLGLLLRAAGRARAAGSSEEVGGPRVR